MSGPGIFRRPSHRLSIGAVVLVASLAAACSASKLQGSEAVAAELGRMRSAATEHVVDAGRRARVLQAIDGLQSDLEEAFLSVTRESNLSSGDRPRMEPSGAAQGAAARRG